ncbi:hypothetical protein ACP4OV_000384 [Aristida adscensionis]
MGSEWLGDSGEEVISRLEWADLAVRGADLATGGPGVARSLSDLGGDCTDDG